MSLNRRERGQLTISVGRRADGALHVRVGGEVDAAHAPFLRHRLSQLLAVAAPCVELDLSAVSFCDAAGARELLTLRRRAREQHVDLVLLAASEAVRLVLHLLGADDWTRGDGR